MMYYYFKTTTKLKPWKIQRNLNIYAFQYYTAFNPKQKERREKQLIIGYTPASRYDNTIIIN